MDSISATIITHNEASNIERCLNSLLGIVSEIVVVDSFSTDETLDICQRYECRITQRHFEGFGSQRQYATGLATHRYVLSIDADEVLSEDLRDAIRTISAEGFRHRMYGVAVQNYICGRAMRHSGWQPNTQVRLFDKRYANWELRDVSERLSYSDSISPAPLPGCIHHYRCADSDELATKERREAEMKAKIIAAGNNRVNAAEPLTRATAAYLKCHIAQMATLDGAVGRKIAAGRFKTTYNAYAIARKIIKERNGR